MTERPVVTRGRRARSVTVPVPRTADRTEAERAGHLSPHERRALGRAARSAVPRSKHAQLTVKDDVPDALALLESQDKARVASLVHLRYKRMKASPFAYYRGAALPMAADLSGTPTSGLRVQLCGDAHALNFALYASPERNLVFDVNDFDETLAGPWEWDVKRLAASVVIAGREHEFTRKQRSAALLATVGSYRTSMARFARLGNLEVWYAKLDIDQVIQILRGHKGSGKDVRGLRGGEREVAEAVNRSNLQATGSLTTVVNGRAQFVTDPPKVERLADLLSEDERHALEERLGALIDGYARSMPPDRRQLIAQFQVADMARKVVGVGSVGMRCWVVLLHGRDRQDPLILQVKEAQPSVLERFLDHTPFRNQGERVVAGQRLMQASSDIFLGWDRVSGIESRRRDVYVRQLHDGKGSFDIGAMGPEDLVAYGRICGWTLARAHARSGDRIAIAAYLGSSDAFDRAIGDFAEAYADKNEHDHRALVKAIHQGRIQA